jgi:hypothetical protein
MAWGSPFMKRSVVSPKTREGAPYSTPRKAVITREEAGLRGDHM